MVNHLNQYYQGGSVLGNYKNNYLRWLCPHNIGLETKD